MNVAIMALMFPLVVISIPFLFVLAIIWLNTRGKSGSKMNDDEYRMVQSLHGEMERMADRMDHLETILTEKIRKPGKGASDDGH